MRRSRRLKASLLISLSLHISAVLWLDETGEPVGRYRARLAPEPRFELPLRLPASEHTVPEVELEYLPPEAPPQLRSEVGLPLPPPTVTVAEELLPGAVKKQSAALTPKPASPELGREALPDPTGRLFTDTSTAESMELLRFVDMARADRYRAAVMADPHSRREVQGYVNFTMLRLDGAGSYPGAAVDELARYIRDYTRIQARIRKTHEIYFLSEELLKDPIHFLFPTLRLGGDLERRTYFNLDELRLLERYLRSGGFLFVDAGGSADDRRFLKEVVALLHKLVLPDGRLFEIPASHPIYHSFYEYENGFPGELKDPVPREAGHRWRYPERPPDLVETRGLWGVELHGDLVAAISDLDLHRQWAGTTQSERDPGEGEGREAEGDGGSADPESDGASQESAPTPKIPFLRAATNVVIYALTRPRGLSQKRAQPAWRIERPAVEPEDEEVAGDDLEEEMFAADHWTDLDPGLE